MRRCELYVLVVLFTLASRIVLADETEGPAPNQVAAVEAAPADAPNSPSGAAEQTTDGAEQEAVLVSGNEPAPADGAAHQLPTAAERIARLERSLDSDHQRLRDMRRELDTPGGEYAKAEENFRELDAKRTAMQARIAEYEAAERTAELVPLRTEAEALERKWSLAKERFDLAIQERKAIQESVNTLEKKLESDRASVDKLKGLSEPAPLNSPPATGALPAAPETGNPPPAAPGAEVPAAPPAPATSAPVGPLGQATLPPAAQPPAEATAPAQTSPVLTEKVAKQLAVASEAAEKSQQAAKVAEAEARSITERIEILQKDIGLQRQLRDTSRQHVDNSEKTLQGLNAELFRKLMIGESVDGIREQIQDATQRLIDNRVKSRKISTGLDELQSQLAQLQADQLTASNNALEAREAAQRDLATVERLKNPFTARNVLQWLLDHGPRTVAILLALGLFMWLSRALESRLVELTAKRGRRGSREERENRAKTLLGVFRNVANIVLIAGGTMMILDEVGVPVAPIIGGAAVFGLAVAFGAQSLIKDYFVGFMVLLEQQYLVNDVIGIGDIKGQVERISLRITVLRDLEGRVHFIPHSQISTVTNLTHGWSRAVFEIGVAYKENVDRVIETLTGLAMELRSDDAYKLLILSEPVMLGVDQFADSAVVIKFYIQTRPLQQWTVKREMLRRIKNEFDRLGIEIPFPHLTIYSGAAQHNAQSPAQTEDWPDRGAA